MRRIAYAAAILLAVWGVGLLLITVFHVFLTTVRGSKTESCPNCGKTDTRPSWPAGIVDTLLSGLHHYPYRCRACQYRYYRSRRTPPTVTT